ncbi:MAG: acyloxyacyl hydrolase [Desulfuromonadales bacterium]|nr:acyloxyacyl hydrolase [Desulfuromonadales bacterium]
MNRPGRWPVIEMGSRIGLRSSVQYIARLLLIAVCCTLLPLESAYAEELRLQSLSLRGRISGATLLGEQQPEQFQGYDLAAHFALPWHRYSPAGWGIGSRLMASAGLLRGAGDTGLVVSLIPGLALGSADGRWALDAGAGVALFSRSRFGTQDFGGPFQFALTLGARFPVYQLIGLSYRFVHYSDAGVNGNNTIGADFHMLEFSWHL